MWGKGKVHKSDYQIVTYSLVYRLQYTKLKNHCLK